MKSGGVEEEVSLLNACEREARRMRDTASPAAHINRNMYLCFLLVHFMRGRDVIHHIKGQASIVRSSIT